jgi:MarR family transcriptional regulator for hemolysin
MDRDTLLEQYLQGSQTLYKAWRQRFFDALADADLTPSLIGAMFAVQRLQPVSARQIADEMRITRGAIAHFIESLEALGLVGRITDPGDRRVAYISLTAKGTSRLQKVERIKRRLIKELTCNLSDVEVQQAIYINNKILEALA